MEEPHIQEQKNTTQEELKKLLVRLEVKMIEQENLLKELQSLIKRKSHE